MDAMKQRSAFFAILSLSLALAGSSTGQARKPIRFEVAFPASLRAEPVDGRVLLVLSTKNDPEPRFQVGEALDTAQLFGTDAEGMAPGQAAVIDESAPGYPRESLHDVPDGEYHVQAVLSVYDTFHRADGHTVKLHMDQGEGQHWNSSPGTFTASPRSYGSTDRAETTFVWN
jgi:hypothetical protein